jgi:hypothetical protein
VIFRSELRPSGEIIDGGDVVAEYHRLPKTGMERNVAAAAVSLYPPGRLVDRQALDRTRTTHLGRLHLIPPPEHQ